MDTTHSQAPLPQSVGREFVRQYYTLLNKAPNHLHRFYNSQSSFTHDESTLVVGQKNIHSRIQQLNFQDCHAKISQVNSQATLCNGVVVQVTGELSNNGQPMRRFTQTFVLAAQSPKKYYVHNDIFRYQDVYLEEESDNESRIEGDEENEHSAIQSGQVANSIVEQQCKEQQFIQVGIEQQQAPIQMGDVGLGTATIMGQQRSQAIYYSMSPGDGRPITVLSVPTIAGSAALGTNFCDMTSTVPLQQHDTVQLKNGATNDELMTHGMVQRTSIQTQSSLNNSVQSTAVPQGITASVASDDISCSQTSDETISNNALQAFSQTSRATIENYQQQQQQQLPSCMQTYANLFKSSTSSNTLINAAQHTQNHCNKNSLQASSNISSLTFTQSCNMNSSPCTIIYGARNNSNNGTPNNSSSTNENISIRQGNNQCYQVPLTQRPSSKSFNRDFDHRRPSNFQFDDDQQLFLGNIPHCASEEDLKSIFGRFGTILDLRVLSKAPGKLPTGIRNPLNYGFITYKDAESAHNCLAHGPIYFPENSPNRQKLNVEKKKPRSRANDFQTRQGMSGCCNTGGGGINNNVTNNQRNMNNNGPPPSRSLSNSGAGTDGGNNMVRESGMNNNRSRGGSSGPRMGTIFSRNDNRNSNNGSTGGNNNLQATNKNYGVRR